MTASQPYVWANVLHFTWNGTPPTITALQSMAQTIMAMWASHVSPLQSSQVSLEECTLTDLTSNTAASGSFEQVVPGTRGDEFLAGNVAALVSYPIGVRYRGGHPRTYLFAGQQPDLADTGHWLAAFVTAVNTGWRAFLSGIIGLASGGTSISQQVIVSYYDKNLNPTPPYRRTNPAVFPINGQDAFCQAEVASQRRRIGRKRA